MFENRVLRRIFGPGGGGKWREAGEVCIMRSFIMIKSMRIRWMKHVARVGEIRNAYIILMR
jgi:hypothetical protein